MKARLIFVCLALLSANPIIAQNEWVKAKEKDGIVIYTRETAGSPVKEFKAYLTVQSTLGALVKLVLDADDAAEWHFNVKSCKKVKQYSLQHVEVHTVVAVPWPFDNRDHINEYKASQADNGVVTIKITNKPKAIPPQDGVIRMNTAEGQWVLTPKGAGKVEILYQYKGDPEGGIPSWVVNMFLLDGPMTALKNLQNMIEKPKYKGAKLDWIKEM